MEAFISIVALVLTFWCILKNPYSFAECQEAEQEEATSPWPTN